MLRQQLIQPSPIWFVAIMNFMPQKYGHNLWAVLQHLLNPIPHNIAHWFLSISFRSLHYKRHLHLFLIVQSIVTLSFNWFVLSLKQYALNRRLMLFNISIYVFSPFVIVQWNSQRLDDDDGALINHPSMVASNLSSIRLPKVKN